MPRTATVKTIVSSKRSFLLIDFMLFTSFLKIECSNVFEIRTLVQFMGNTGLRRLVYIGLLATGNWCNDITKWSDCRPSDRWGTNCREESPRLLREKAGQAP